MTTLSTSLRNLSNYHSNNRNNNNNDDDDDDNYKNNDDNNVILHIPKQFLIGIATESIRMSPIVKQNYAHIIPGI